MNWSTELVEYVKRLRADGHGYRKIATCVSTRTGIEVTPKAIERLFARQRTRWDGDIPVYFDDDDTEITTSVEVPRPHASNDNAVERMLIVPDCHFPFVDRRAWNLMLDVARSVKPSVIVTLGDFIDCESISSHDRDLSKPRVTLKEEFDSGKAARAELDSLGAKSKFAILGNHEYRAVNYVARKCPELYGMLDVAKELEYAKHGWSVTEYKDYLQIGDAFFTHDEGNAGALAHVKARDTFNRTVSIGHTHRTGFAQCTAIDGSPTQAAMFGWLGRTDCIKYLHRAKLRHWQHGFGLGAVEASGRVHLQPVTISDYRCVVDGRLFDRPQAA